MLSAAPGVSVAFGVVGVETGGRALAISCGFGWPPDAGPETGPAGDSGLYAIPEGMEMVVVVIRRDAASSEPPVAAMVVGGALYEACCTGCD